jgi:predicted CxxxxCH...CXXCH cytochrome family protein
VVSPISAGASIGCASCHGNPPATAAHAKHINVNLTGVTCSACHNGAGTGAAAVHDNVNRTAAVISISTTFNPETGSTPTYSSGTCSSVSCHGGQSTPNWTSTYTIDYAANDYCNRCHQLRDALISASLQYNSYGSATNDPNGLHSRHVINGGALCADCHDPALLTSSAHFGGLTTPAMTGANITIRTSIDYRPNASNMTCFNVPDYNTGVFAAVSGMQCHSSGIGGVAIKQNWKPYP